MRNPSTKHKISCAKSDQRKEFKPTLLQKTKQKEHVMMAANTKEKKSKATKLFNSFCNSCTKEKINMTGLSAFPQCSVRWPWKI